jgi:hypothetical protein
LNSELHTGAAIALSFGQKKSMKTILRFICILTTVGAFVASGQEVSPDAKEAAKAIIAKANVATTAVSRSYEEYRTLSKQQEAGVNPLTEKEKKRLAQIWTERRASLELMRQVAGLLKVGESILSYPGLLTLSEVEFNGRDNKYSMRLVIDYKGYEGGVERHPTYRIVEFNEEGRITEIEEFETVRMVTE